MDLLLPTDLHYRLEEFSDHLIQSMGSFRAMGYSCLCFSRNDAEQYTYRFDEDHVVTDPMPVHFSFGKEMLLLSRDADNRSSILGFKIGKKKYHIFPMMLVAYDSEADVFRIGIAANSDFLDAAILLSFISQEFENVVIEDFYIYLWSIGTIPDCHYFFFGGDIISRWWNYRYGHQFFFLYGIPDCNNKRGPEEDLSVDAFRNLLTARWKMSDNCFQEEHSSFCLRSDRIKGISYFQGQR